MANLKLELDPETAARLIGDDTEMRLVLREWVANEMARRYLKPLVNDKAIRDQFAIIGDRVAAMASDLFAAEIGTIKQEWNGRVVKLADGFREEIRNTAKVQAERLYNETVDQRIGIVVQEAVDRAMERITDDRIMASFDAKLNAAIDKRIDALMAVKLGGK